MVIKTTYSSMEVLPSVRGFRLSKMKIETTFYILADSHVKFIKEFENKNRQEWEMLSQFLFWVVSGAPFSAFGSLKTFWRARRICPVFLEALKQVLHKNGQEWEMLHQPKTPSSSLKSCGASWRARTMFSVLFSNSTTVSTIKKLYFTIHIIFPEINLDRLHWHSSFWTLLHLPL